MFGRLVIRNYVIKLSFSCSIKSITL